MKKKLEMKKRIYQVAFATLCYFVVVSAVYAGGTSHENCQECNLALGKKVNVMILADSRGIIRDTIECK